MKQQLIVAAATLLILTGLASTPLRADSIIITLDDPVQSAASGTVVSFFATISAPAGNNAPVYLNGDTFDFGTSPFIGDESGLFANFPVFLNPGDSHDDVLFTVTLPTGTPIGISFQASYQLQGGIDDADQTVLGSRVFIVNTIAPPPTVPEPSSFLLVSSGLIIIGRRLQQ